MEYHPLFGRVLIKREVHQKTRGGILIPEQQQKRNAKSEGVIVALGHTAGFTTVFENGEEKKIQTLKIGDRVVFGKHAGTWLDATYSGSLENDDGTMFICQDEDILAIMED